MLILCSECGNRLRADTGCIGVFGKFEFFDDTAGSDTYGKQVTRCPGCGLSLYYGSGIEQSDIVHPG